MKDFKFAPEVKVGDIFTRVDKNGNVWKAEVINRTELFVDVKKYDPYERKFQTGYYEWEYEKRLPEPTEERAQLYIEYEEYETGNMKKTIFGTYPETAKRPTGKFYIAIKEDYSKYPQYDKIYFLNKGLI
jgi:hypothetical protein